MSEPVTDPNELPEGAPDDPLTGHDYDGIQEYDNPTPSWWYLVFAATVVFSVCYNLARFFEYETVIKVFVDPVTNTR